MAVRKSSGKPDRRETRMREFSPADIEVTGKLSRYGSTDQPMTDYRANTQQAVELVLTDTAAGSSYARLDILMNLQRRAPIHFELVAVNLDQKQPGFPEHVLPEYLTRLGVPFRIEEQDTYSTVKRLLPEGKTMCSLCSRLRRGVLYRVAGELGATKIALGHHRDDILATFFLNLFFGGKLKAMPPKLKSDDGKHIVIRPLAYVKEDDLSAHAEEKGFPIIPCNLCGSQEHLQRRQVRELLRQWEKQHPGRVESILSALGDVRASHLLDRKLFDFPGLKTGLNT